MSLLFSQTPTRPHTHPDPTPTPRSPSRRRPHDRVNKTRGPPHTTSPDPPPRPRHLPLLLGPRVRSPRPHRRSARTIPSITSCGTARREQPQVDGHDYGAVLCWAVLVVKRAVNVADDADSAPLSTWCTRHTSHSSEPVSYHEADEPVHQRRRPSCPAGTMGFMFTLFFLRYIPYVHTSPSR